MDSYCLLHSSVPRLEAAGPRKAILNCRGDEVGASSDVGNTTTWITETSVISYVQVATRRESETIVTELILKKSAVRFGIAKLAHYCERRPLVVSLVFADNKTSHIFVKQVCFKP